MTQTQQSSIVPVLLPALSQLIEANGGLAKLSERYIRIENPPWMRLVIEDIGPQRGTPYRVVSVCHYGEQNDDPMRDPDVTAAVLPAANGRPPVWIPLTFRNDYAGVECDVLEISNDDPLWFFLLRDMEAYRDLVEFMAMWDRNIREQGFLERF